jgi:hypothetical protein
VAKPNIRVLEGLVLVGEYQGLATVQQMARNGWQKKGATPTGFESLEGTSEKHKHYAALRVFLQCSSGVRVRRGNPPRTTKIRQKPCQSRPSWQIRGKENGRGKRPVGENPLGFLGALAF